MLYGPTYLAIAKVPSGRLRVVQYNGQNGSRTNYVVNGSGFTKEYFDLDWKKYRYGLVLFQVGRKMSTLIKSEMEVFDRQLPPFTLFSRAYRVFRYCTQDPGSYCVVMEGEDSHIEAVFFAEEGTPKPEA